MKSIDSTDEVEESKTAISTLGAELNENYDYTIPDTEITHRALVIRKTKEAPKKYPRRFARMQKAPL
jgi:16S rRNA (guanine527-N7)-methyltransferase